MATEISRLRCFLSLIIEYQRDDSKDNFNINPLPNLEFKFVAANSFLKLPPSQLEYAEYAKDKAQICQLRNDYFNPNNDKKAIQKAYQNLRNKIFDNLTLQTGKTHPLASYDPFDELSVAEFFDAEFMFGVESFDIAISNPPYISTKGDFKKYKKEIEAQDGFFDDSYNHAFFICTHYLKENGVLSLITPKTFWTISTKKKLRGLIFANKPVFICDSANPFASAMVDTCITELIKSPSTKEHKLEFIDASKDFDKPEIYTIPASLYANTYDLTIFKPSPYNLAIYDKYNDKVKALMKRYWKSIKTSAKITKNQVDISHHRAELRPGDITLLGLITDGGQGLATANNGKYVALKSGTKEAIKAKETRAEKLFKAKAIWQDLNLEFKNKKDALSFLEDKQEQEIWQIFDEAKEKFGRDIFGQGFLYRIIDDTLIADVKALSDDEKLNGIDSPKCFVPYDKGDKDGNRWYLPTSYYIAWSKENVAFLKTNSGKKGEGMPVVRNPQFYFKEGFCWNNVLQPKNEESMFIKCRIKEQSVNDVASMSLYTQFDSISNAYIVAILNSKFMYEYLKVLINASVNLQINDFRQMPIVIPTNKELKDFEDLFNQVCKIQQDKFSKLISEQEARCKLEALQQELDLKVLRLYGVDF